MTARSVVPVRKNSEELAPDPAARRRFELMPALLLATKAVPLVVKLRVIALRFALLSFVISEILPAEVTKNLPAMSSMAVGTVAPIPTLPEVSIVKNGFVPGVVPSPIWKISLSSPPASSVTPIQKSVSMAVTVSKIKAGSALEIVILPVEVSPEFNIKISSISVALIQSVQVKSDADEARSIVMLLGTCPSVTAPCKFSRSRTLSNSVSTAISSMSTAVSPVPSTSPAMSIAASSVSSVVVSIRSKPLRVPVLVRVRVSVEVIPVVVMPVAPVIVPAPVISIDAELRMLPRVPVIKIPSVMVPAVSAI